MYLDRLNIRINTEKELSDIFLKAADMLFILCIVPILIELRLIKYFTLFAAVNLGKLLVCINCIPFPVDVADSILRPFFYRDVKINAIFISPVVYIDRVLQYAHIPEAIVPI